VTVTTTAEPAGANTVSGGGIFARGKTVTLQAQPAADFVEWRIAGSAVSTANPYSFTETEDRMVTGVFSQPATILITGLQQDFDGTAKPATVTTVPTGLATEVTYNGSSTVPSGIGTYTVRAVVTDRFYRGEATAQMTIKLPDTTGPVLADWTYGPVVFADGLPVSKGDRVSASATDPAGVSRVEFYVRAPGSSLDLFLGSSTTAPSYSAFWNAGATLVDGVYVMTVKAFDMLGNVTTESRTVNLTLPPPVAPVITFPANNSAVTTATTETRGTAAADATLKLYRNGVVVFSGFPNPDGTFAVSVPLVAGQNLVYAESSNRAGVGPASNQLTITSQTTLPELTLTLADPSVTEGGSVVAAVTLDAPLALPLTVAFTSSSSRVSAPSSLIVPAGETFKGFTIQAMQNQSIDLPVTVSFTASAAGFIASSSLSDLGFQG